jgi:NADH:ubiquinone oxidoreductase subunit C
MPGYRFSLKNFMLYSFLFNYVEKLSQKIPLENILIYGNEIVCVCSKKNLNFILIFLSRFTYCQFKVLSYISAVDYPEKKNRFEVVYDLLSVKFNTRLRLKVFVNEVSGLPSSSSIFKAAN